MFAVTNLGGMATATVPDVCNTPAPPAPPVPIPYPNIVQGTTLSAGKLAKKVTIANGKAAHLKSETMLSSGDEAGTVGGVASAKFIGKMNFNLGSMKVKIEGQSAVRMGDMTSHNQKNTIGAFNAPSQSKVMIN